MQYIRIHSSLKPTKYSTLPGSCINQTDLSGQLLHDRCNKYIFIVFHCDTLEIQTTYFRRNQPFGHRSIIIAMKETADRRGRFRNQSQST